MKTKTTQSQQIIYASMLVLVATLAIAIIFKNAFYAGLGFGFVTGLVVGATYITAKISETQNQLKEKAEKDHQHID